MSDLNDFFYTDGVHDVLATYINALVAGNLRGQLSNTESLSANKTLVEADFPLQVYSPTADRSVTLPAVGATNHPFYIVNTSTSYTLTIKNAGGTTIGTIAPASYGSYLSNGSTWYSAQRKYTQVFGSHGLSQQVPGATTQYMSIFGTGFLAALSANPVQKNGTLKNLRVRTGSAQPGTGSMVVTLNVGGSPSALTLTIAAGAAAGSFADTTHSVAYSAGSNIRFDFQNNASTASAQVGMVTFDMVLDTE